MANKEKNIYKGEKMATCKMINENRFFSKVLPYIGKKDAFLEEIIENAVRAKASSIYIKCYLDDNRVVAVNNGEILKDFTSLFKVAETGYDPEVIRKQHPAGMGVMMMLSASSKAIFTSGNKSIEVEGSYFFNDPEYRENILKNIKTLPSEEEINGFKIELFNCEPMKWLVLQSSASGKYYVSRTENYVYYPIDINMEVVTETGETQKIDIPNYHYTKHNYEVCVDGTGELKGIKICLSDLGVDGQPFLHPYDNIVWHGKRIGWTGDYFNQSSVILFIEDNHLLTPTLPYRKTLQNSDDEVYELIRKAETQAYDQIKEFLIKLDSQGKYRIVEQYLNSLLLDYKHEYGFWTIMDHDGTEKIKTRESLMGYSLIQQNSDDAIARVKIKSADGKVRVEENVLFDYANTFEYSSNIALYSGKIGGTSEPDWYKTMTQKEVEVEVVEGHMSYKTDFYFYHDHIIIVEDIKVNGSSIPYIKYSNDDVGSNTCYVTIDAYMDMDEYVYNLAEYWGENSEDFAAEFYNTMGDKIKLYQQKADISDFLSSIELITGKKLERKGKLSFEVDFDKKIVKIPDLNIKVMI